MIRNLVRFVIVLSLVCVLSGGGVALLYAVFKGDLQKREDAARQEAITAVCPEGATINTEKPVAGQPFADDAVYAAAGADGKPVAYIAGGAAQGYSSMVRVMVGAKAGDLSVVRVAVLSQAETPGLGTNVAEQKSNFTLWEKVFGPGQAGKAEATFNPFLDQFPGKKVDGFGEIHAMTAATITSNATKAAVEQAITRIQKATGKAP